MMSEPSPLHVQTSDIEIENKAINTRRKELGLNEIDDTGTVGLALSGGGIRSATFCLGLVRALAKKGLLKNRLPVDSLRWGIFRGMLGRLYALPPTNRPVEQSLASDDTILLAWLRNNGRYLTPAGFLDKSLAITQIFRSFLASLFLLTLMCLVVSGIAISLNTLLVLEPKALATPLAYRARHSSLFLCSTVALLLDT
jgi:hypothetical protein